ncbi:MAG: hypothetical protein LBR14_01435 [Clostridiales Family XIII bacterium]|jgi:hypothetical protein|nr:hypothetical protein [Clostridiales Family XIII bacterium]
MSDHLIHIRVVHAENPNRLIPILRKHSGLSIAELRDRIENGYAATIDLRPPFDITDDLNNVEPGVVALRLNEELRGAGALTQLIEERGGTPTPITREQLETLIQRTRETAEEVSKDTECEVTGKD